LLINNPVVVGIMTICVILLFGLRWADDKILSRLVSSRDVSIIGHISNNKYNETMVCFNDPPLFSKKNQKFDAEKIRFMMRCILSLVICASGLYIILGNGYSQASQDWAYGAVGSVVGYWFKK